MDVTPNVGASVIALVPPRNPVFKYILASYAFQATPTDFVIIQGSAQKVGLIKRIKIGGVATANGNMPFQVLRRSSLGTPGSAALTAITGAKHDPNDPAPVLTVSSVGTANLTAVGTAVATLIADRLGLCTTATGVPTPREWKWADKEDKPIVIRGANDFIVLNGVGGAVPAGAAFDLELEIEEALSY